MKRTQAIIVMTTMALLTGCAATNVTYFSNMGEANAAFFDNDPSVIYKKLITSPGDKHEGEIKVKYRNGM
jgi:hypothetical protein